jgi:hypothetical protein
MGRSLGSRGELTLLRSASQPRAIIAVLASALSYFIVDKFWLSKRPAAATESVAAGGATPAAFNPPPHSIAVLPFVNLSGDRGLRRLHGQSRARGGERTPRRATRRSSGR